MDKRVINTKKLLKKTLIELLDNRGIEEITILELCTKSKVNRTTFYNHYEDIYQLFDEIVNDVLKDYHDSILGIRTVNINLFLGSIYDFIQRHKNIFKIIIKNRIELELAQKIIEISYKEFIELWYQFFHEISKEEVDMLFHSIFFGTVSLMTARFEVYSKKELISFTSKFVINALKPYSKNNLSN